MARSATATGWTTVALLCLAFAFRLFYGLSMPFWSEDERQVYLIGLQSFARGEWPYFGADVVWTGGQVPGALLGMLIRAPLAVWPAPEAPFVLLNLLSFAALALFAWFLCRRFPDVPRWLVWSALLALPWTLNFSTHLVNPSYVLQGSIVFLVGFLEGWPAMRRRILPFWAAWAMMGAGLFFVMQMHMSWVLLPPYAIAAAISLVLGRPDRLETTKGRALLHAAAGFIAGAAITGSLLAPTVLRYGFGAGHVEGVISFQLQSPVGLLTTAARVLSFASFEINRFLGLSTAERFLLLSRQWWMVPFVFVVGLAGVVQPLWMAFTLFRRASSDAGDWARARGLIAATILLVYGSFFFSVRGPQAHSFYVVFPVAAFFACSCWQVCARATTANRRRWERVAATVIISAVIVHIGLASDRWPRQSLYADRSVVAAAVAQPNDRYLGDRRDTVTELVDHRPRSVDGVADVEAYVNGRPEEALRVVSIAWAPGAQGISRFRLTVVNESRVAAWLDIRYETAYVGADGRPLVSRTGVIKRIIQPGGTLADLDVADDFVPAGATAATLTIVTAEKCIPVRR